MIEDEADLARRRRRRRATSAQGPAPVVAVPSAASDDSPTAARPQRKRRPTRDGGSERNLRELVGSGRSQLGVSGALRARDVDRPTAQDLADAERDTVIVRRNWQPDANRNA